MDKLVIFLILVTLLSMADCRHHQYTHHQKRSNRLKLSTKNSQSLESYLNEAIKNLQQGSPISAENNNNAVVSQNEDRENMAKQYVRQLIENNKDTKRSKLQNRRASQDDTGDEPDTGKSSKPSHRNLKSKTSRADRADSHDPTVGPPPALPPTPKIKLPTWKVLKRLIKQEFKKHNKNKPTTNTIVIHDDDRVTKHDGVVGNTELVPKGTVIISDKTPNDGKNWLVFGIGMSSTVMLFMLCILGYHCFRYLRFRDGLFARTEFMHVNYPPRSCRNNNHLDGSLQNQKKEENWSSEEEVFNISMPRSFHGALSGSNSSAIRHSTPIKKPTPTR